MLINAYIYKGNKKILILVVHTVYGARVKEKIVSSAYTNVFYPKEF